MMTNGFVSSSPARTRHKERWNMIGNVRAQSAPSVLLSLSLICLSAATAFAQTATQPPDHSDAYYDFAMAHLYAELAGAYGNRGEYVNKAIDFYKQAIKADPSA